MPTPLEILVDPISLVVIAIYLVLIGVESLRPARTLSRIRGWRLRGLVSFAAFFYLASYLPILWDEHLAAFQLFDLSGWGTVGGLIAGVLLYEFGVYWWHRAMHRSTVLWRSFHQMHHSAERMDAYGAFYFSPLDMIGWTALSSVCLVLVIGLSPQAATGVVFATTFLGIFQHTNISTPRWLGYFVQRPESHAVHHARDIHAFNYSDLPIFDLLFGTFSNPPGYVHESGFYDGASARVGDMLLCRDVTKPASPEPFALAITN